MGAMKHARIRGNYYELEDSVFELAFKIYNGEDYMQLVTNQQTKQLEQVFEFMTIFNQKIDEFFSNFDYKFRIKPPEINKLSQKNHKFTNNTEFKEENYAEEISGKLNVKFIKKNDS